MKEIELKEKSIIFNIENILIKIIDAKNSTNLTEANKKIAIVDIMKLLNLVYSEIISLKEQNAKLIFNKYQDFWFKAITNANKRIKYPLLKINNNLWRVYLLTIFKKEDKENILKDLTGWNINKLSEEKLSEDMKMIMLSFINIKK